LETVSYKNATINALDVGGRTRIRNLVRNVVVVVVVDNWWSYFD